VDKRHEVDECQMQVALELSYTISREDWTAHEIIEADAA
jgi:hypothetical protein